MFFRNIKTHIKLCIIHLHIFVLLLYSYVSTKIMARCLLNESNAVTTFKLFPEEKTRLREAAEAQQLSVSEFIRRALAPWIQDHTTHCPIPSNKHVSI